jgi:hypothetical protein
MSPLSTSFVNKHFCMARSIVSHHARALLHVHALRIRIALVALLLSSCCVGALRTPSHPPTPIELIQSIRNSPSDSSVHIGGEWEADALNSHGEGGREQSEPRAHSSRSHTDPDARRLTVPHAASIHPACVDRTIPINTIHTNTSVGSHEQRRAGSHGCTG